MISGTLPTACDKNSTWGRFIKGDKTAYVNPPTVRMVSVPRSVFGPIVGILHERCYR